MEAGSPARILLDREAFNRIISINIVIYIMNTYKLICICLRRGT